MRFSCLSNFIHRPILRRDHGGGKPRLCTLSRLLTQLPRLALRQHPGDAVGEVFGVEGFGEVAGALMFDDVRQPAGVEGDHRGGAGVGFDAGVGQIVLARGARHGIGGAVERTQAEVIVQVAGVMDGEAEVLHEFTAASLHTIFCTALR